MNGMKINTFEQIKTTGTKPQDGEQRTREQGIENEEEDQLRKQTKRDEIVFKLPVLA